MSNQQDSQSQLTSHLRDQGLDDAEFWIPKFEKLGVKSLQSLPFLEGDDDTYSELKGMARNIVEKRVLKKLLKIEEPKKENSCKKKEETNSGDEFEESQKLADEPIKGCYEARVQKSEVDDICDHENDSSDDLISKPHFHLPISGKLQQRGCLSDSMLLQKVSGGRALQGIYLTKNLEDQLQVRDQLLEVPQNVVITRVAQTTDITKHFSSTHQEDEYRKTVEVLGHSATAASMPVYDDVTLGMGVSKEEQVHQEEEVYASSLKFSTLHVASYSFDSSAFKLSTDAKNDLEEISRVLRDQKPDSSDVQEACKRFFRRYGSHANRGPLNFGGSLKWKCFSKGFENSEIGIVNQMLSDAVSATSELSFAGFGVTTEVSMENIKSKFSSDCSKKTLANTHLVVTVEGGPPEAVNLPTWKSGLVANNSTWLLTDRGQKLEAVWDIIKKNQQKELGDVRDVLRSTWESVIGLTAQHNFLPTFKFKPDSIIEEVSQWNEEILTPHEIEGNLGRLIKIKEDIMSKVSDPFVWINEYILNPVIQKFFESIVDAEEEPSENVKLLMQRLLVKEELAQVSTQSPTIGRISDWLYKSIKKPIDTRPNITDLDSFEEFMKNTLDPKLSLMSTASKAMTDSQIAWAISHLLSFYEGKYESVLISILISPYQDENCTTLKPFTPEGLECLHKSFSEERIKFNQYMEKKNPLHLQVYLLKLLLHMKIFTEIQLKASLHKAKKMMNSFYPPLNKNLLTEIDKVISSSTVESSLLSFKEQLNFLMTTHHQRHPPHLLKGHSLQHVLKTKSHKHAHGSKNPQTNQYSIFRKNNKAYNLFKKLDLCKHYPMGLQLKDALCVKSGPLKLSLYQTHPTSLKDLPDLVIHKLMSYDHRCRSDLMHTKTQDSENNEDGTDNKVAIGLDCESIHPVDSLLSVLICSNNFLRQDLLSRLAKCQLAVPFILPDPFTQQLSIPLWAMRSIIKEWKCIDSEEKIAEKTCPITKYKMPIISFIRFGKRQKRGISKSKLLNDAISSESNHNHFFHRDLAGGRSEVLLGKGLVDMCWYLSSGKKNETFPDAITFLNLHGDAREYLQQSKFLSKISFMCFVLLTEEDLEFSGEIIKILKEFSSSPGGITILNDTEESPAKLIREVPKASIITLTDKNASEIKTSVQNRIKKRLQTIDLKDLKTLEDWCNWSSAAVRNCKVIIDEGCCSFKEGFDLATDIQNIVTCYKAKESSRKEGLLPLQGDLWQRWAFKNKELYRQVHRGSKPQNIYTDEIILEKQVLRQGQLVHVESLTPVMEAFITALLKLGGPSNRIARNYFLECLKLGLNEFSRDQISALQHQYQSIRIKLSDIQEKTDIHEGGTAASEKQISLMNGYKEKMKCVQNKIIQASFGLEHILRELGQIYEATKSMGLPITGLSRLPEAAAELLIEGYPLELMDGDAAHVPLCWLTSVINEVATKLGDPKVFILSVLGLQSTGKSTMLNTAFGLQFNVSSGRCTRGAFMQLLPLDDQLRKKTGFSYVLIVDTEGLRAPELDSEQTHKHDNELATFVIGLANMTLINIYGEVPGDMDDILQTSVHAFLRMSKVMKYRKSCQFVHQNAGSGINTEVGRANFTQKLDKFTVDAAKEENVEGQYKAFNDVIKFNDLKNVHHFPGLWKGDPPMAPINPGYSEAAQNLKSHLIEILSESRAGVLLFSSFEKKVFDIWNALLKENFIFSFKNTLEITAYNSLETQYSQWEWEFREAMLKWERTEENEITTAEPSTVSKLVHEKCKELNEHINKLYGDHKSEMDKFFSDSKQSEILIQWKGRFETKLTNLREELKIHAVSHCKQLGQGREVISQFEKERIRYTALMTENVQKLIETLKQHQEELHANLRRKKLEQSQVKKILTLDLFAPDYLKQYRGEGIITEAQEKSLHKIVGVSLTEQGLNHIVVEGVLSTEQMIKILNQGCRSEQELETKFNSDWVVMLEKLPIVPVVSVDVEPLVESALLDHVGGYDGQVLVELRKLSLKKRGASLELAVDDKEHYILKSEKKNRWYEKQTVILRVYTFFGGTITDPHQMEAQQITDDVLEIAKSHVKSITDSKSDFNSAFTHKLLRLLDNEIAAYSSRCKQQFTFTQAYKFDVYLSACSYAVIEFQKMADSYRKKNNPRLYLEAEIKGPLFTRFKNQYYQKKAEEGVANTLCAHFDGPIRTQVRKSLGSTIVGQMKNSEHHFKSKMALKVKILTDLYHEDHFDSYMVYVTNVKRCLEEKLKHYTIQYCDEKVLGLKNTRLQSLAKEEVTELTQFVENQVIESNANERNFMAWLKNFCENVEVRRKLGVKLNVKDITKGYDSESVQLENVKIQIRKGLANSKKNLHATFGNIKCENEMENWKDKPHVFLKELVGCTEQCPFCGEQCDLQDADHAVNHRISVHRSGCLGGFRWEDTKIMCTEFCPTCISGKSRFKNKDTDENWVDYSKYQTIYPKWTIVPDVTSGDSLYWMSFIGRYKDRIAKRFIAEPPIVPEGWSKIEWVEIETNLKKLYNL